MTPAAGGKVLVVGDVMTDIIVKPEGPLNRGSDRRAAIRSRPGGSGANQAVWLGAMGADVRFVARVGAEDKAGLESYFRGFSVEAMLVADRKHPSGVLVTIVDPDGERSFLTDRGANLELCADDLPESLLDGVGLVVVSGYSFFAPGPRAAVRGLFALARSRGIKVAVDPASVGFLHEVGVGNFLDWTDGASILFANDAEALALSGYHDSVSQMAMLGQRFERVVIKRGALGAVIGTRDGISLDLPAPRVPVVDSTGAGDAFAAGFIAAQLRGADETACLKAGIAAGSEAVKVIGGQPVRVSGGS
ncbi:carbohydrate kinase family protein [Paradevosia shaoguanensis]|uniref:Sugar kinase n=1 Tax=Paradevosia shaoguanensis TaxID=1335043 RepID=A0AA41QQQ5_9HYPH|nr:sugar kinase [Paradevosia shaoguanensis]MCF1744803.1 sugar kinase [Paradevosia shaoguanensis]MCI0129286.1 sugar kinase [Paradevosia shaoguanensis]